MKDNKGSDTSFEAELFVVEKRAYGHHYKEHLLEQYKLYVEMADRICSRRSAANTFFLTANSFLAAIIGISSKLQQPLIKLDLWWVILASAAGILLSLSWYRIIGSYCQLSRAKYGIINAIEHRLPLAMYKAEWSYLKPEGVSPRYTQLTAVEKIVPLVFTVLYSVLVIIGFYVGFIGPLP